METKNVAFEYGQENQVVLRYDMLRDGTFFPKEIEIYHWTETKKTPLVLLDESVFKNLLGAIDEIRGESVKRKEAWDAAHPRE